ncbi:MAG: LysR substrate-binding domain-containing protein [Eggerthella lenta]
MLRLGLCASPLYGYEQACASIASFVYKNSGIETSIRLEAGLRGFGALQAGHLDALIVVGACRHPDMDCLNLGKVMLGVIMSYRHPLAQHQTVSLDDIKPYPVSISEDFDRFNDSVAEFYRERGIDILVSATTAAQFERYLTRENGLALTVGVPALGQFNPHRVETHGGQGFRFRAYLPRQPQRTQGTRLCGLRALDDERACRQRRRSGQEVRVHDGFYSCMF